MYVHQLAIKLHCRATRLNKKTQSHQQQKMKDLMDGYF